MTTIKTIDERRAEAVARLRAAVVELRPLLAAEAARLGGRYILFGSAARDEMHPDSDVDLLLDFPHAEAETRAWTFAEDACHELRLHPDIRPLPMTTPRFRDHVLPTAIPLP